MDVKMQSAFPVESSRAAWTSTNPRRGCSPKNPVMATVIR